MKKPQVLPPMLPDLNETAVDTTGRIKILRVVPYHGVNIYIRQIDEVLFLYDLSFKDQIYSNYIVMTLDKGKTKLTKKEVQACEGLIFQGARATVEYLLGIVDERDQAIGQEVIAAGDKVWGKDADGKFLN